MRTGLTLLALLLAAPAAAGDAEISADLGVVAIGDDTYDRFDADNALPSWGLRGAYGLDDTFSVVGAVRWGRQGVQLLSDTEDTALNTAYSASSIALGVRAETRVTDTFVPYAVVNAVGFVGQMQLDDDATSRTNPGQLRATSASFGGNVAGGFALRFEQDKTLTPIMHLEVGWTGILPHGYSITDAAGNSVRIGTLGWSSPTVRGGVGVRF